MTGFPSNNNYDWMISTGQCQAKVKSGHRISKYRANVMWWMFVCRLECEIQWWKFFILPKVRLTPAQYVHQRSRYVLSAIDILIWDPRRLLRIASAGQGPQLLLRVRHFSTFLISLRVPPILVRFFSLINVVQFAFSKMFVLTPNMIEVLKLLREAKQSKCANHYKWG